MLAEKAKREKAKLNPEPFPLKASGQKFYNALPLDLKKLMGDQMNIGENLRAYIQGFAPVVLRARSWRECSLPVRHNWLRNAPGTGSCCSGCWLVCINERERRIAVVGWILDRNRLAPSGAAGHQL